MKNSLAFISSPIYSSGQFAIFSFKMDENMKKLGKVYFININVYISTYIFLCRNIKIIFIYAVFNVAKWYIYHKDHY